jgi:hypothetical protein
MMKLSNLTAKLTGMKFKVGGVLAAATLAGAVLVAGTPAAQAQGFGFGIQIGGPRYYAPPPPVAVYGGYGYGGPVVYGNGYYNGYGRVYGDGYGWRNRYYGDDRRGWGDDRRGWRGDDDHRGWGGDDRRGWGGEHRGWGHGHRHGDDD